jgi:hypothetical protein
LAGVTLGDMKAQKKLIRRLSALEEIVAKLREDVDMLKQHKMATIVECTKNKNTTAKKDTKNKNANPKMRLSLRDIIFKSEKTQYFINVIRMIIKLVDIIIEWII